MTGVQRDFTGGPLSIMHFANELVLNGFKVRWINVDGEGLKGKEFRMHASKYSFLRKFVEEVEFVYNARSSLTTLTLHPKDIFVATLYYTAQLAHFTAKSHGFLQKNFIYFIQDFEPIFFPHGSDFIHAHESYEFPHFPIISTDFLHVWFREKKYGLYKHIDSSTADQLSFAAQPAIKRWKQLNKSDFAAPNRTRVLISYARKHADRNAYALLIDSLSVAVCEGIFKGDWRFIGLGSLQDYKIYLGTHCGKRVLFDIKVNIPEPEYLQLVRKGDIGVSLMISPHPSLPPFDFAAAGLISVTNSFYTKTKEMFESISQNFVVTEPYVSDIVKGLAVAVNRSEDIDARQRNADAFQWETHWGGPRCYGSVLMGKIKAWQLIHDPLWTDMGFLDCSSNKDMFCRHINRTVALMPAFEKESEKTKELLALQDLKASADNKLVIKENYAVSTEPIAITEDRSGLVSGSFIVVAVFLLAIVLIVGYRSNSGRTKQSRKIKTEREV